MMSFPLPSLDGLWEHRGSTEHRNTFPHHSWLDGAHMEGLPEAGPSLLIPFQSWAVDSHLPLSLNPGIPQPSYSQTSHLVCFPTGACVCEFPAPCLFCCDVCPSAGKPHLAVP